MQNAKRKKDYLISCPICSIKFIICHRCFRGHKYCSRECRDRGYEDARRRARKKYAQSPEAKLDHRDRNRIYRLGKKLNEENTVMDKSSKKITSLIEKQKAESVVRALLCIYCGANCFSGENLNEFSKSTSDISYSHSSRE